MTRTSAIIKQECDKTGCSSFNIRYSSIPCNLKTVLKPHAQLLEKTFHTYAISDGLYRRIVSLFTNYILIKSQTIEITNWFDFYKKVWASVAFKFSSAHMSEKRIHYKSEADAFFKTYEPTEYMKEQLLFKTPCMTRQQECNTLAENAILHMKQFPIRLSNFMRASVVLIQKQCGKVKDDASIAFRLVKCILCRPEEYKENVTALVSECNDLILFKRIEILLKERELLGSLVCSCKYTKQKKIVTGTVLDSILEGGKGEEQLYKLIPHLKRYSDGCLNIQESEGLVPKRIAIDESEEDESEENESEEDESGEKPMEDWIWTKPRKPKTFSMLPICKLQRSMGYFGITEIKAMFGALYTEDKTESKRQHDKIKKANNTRKRKRDRDSITENEEDGNKWEYDGAYQFCNNIDEINIFNDIFNLKKIKGRYGIDNKWKLCNFRTNGVKCVLTFVSGSSPSVHGSTDLLRPGYKYIKIPESPINVRTEERGLYRLNEYRNDLLPLKKDKLSDITFHLVDPGFNKIVQGGNIPATCESLPDKVVQALEQPNGLWHVTQDEFMSKSGRLDKMNIEKKRRIINPLYNQSIQKLSKTRCRCSDDTLFGLYVNTTFETFEIMATELTHKGRSISSWQAFRSMQSYIAGLANRMFNKSSFRWYRQPEIINKTLSAEEKTDLRKILKLKKRNQPEKTVVFFGDGTFKSSRRGKASVPKKSILKVLSTIGLTVLLGEYNTSKQCPCGKGELITPLSHTSTSGSRVRVHKTSGGKCSVLERVEDRDEVSLVNFGISCLRSVNGESWPEHLCRACSV